MAALHAQPCLRDHVVAQVVEAELGVGPVGDVCCVRGPPAAGRHAVLQQADAHAHEAVDGAHPLAVAPGQVVVDRDDVDAPAVDGVEVAGERGDERLALAGPHLGYHAAMQDDAAHELHGEVAHPEGAPRGLPHGGEGLREQLVELLPPLVAFPKVRGHTAQFLVRHGLEALREVIDLAGYPLELLLTHALAHREGMCKQTFLSRRTHSRSSRTALVWPRLSDSHIVAERVLDPDFRSKFQIKGVWACGHVLSSMIILPAVSYPLPPSPGSPSPCPWSGP